MQLNESALASHGAQTIAKGSKSFAIASLLFGKAMQSDVHMLYAWCRYCDDVIDGQELGGDAPDRTLSRKEMAERLDELRAKTRTAFSGDLTGTPAFDGFSLVARRHDLPERYPLDLLDGFANDVDQREFTSFDDLMEYCYGVAGVVGIMMAIIMGVSKDDGEVLDRACDLGLAFQLTNICRDVFDDARGGRIYLPTSWLEAENISADPSAIMHETNRAGLTRVVKQVLAIADRYYDSASEGVRFLPLRASAAVLAARNVYRDIGRKVAARGEAAWENRTVVSTHRKVFLAVSGAASGAVQSISKGSAPLTERGDLWRRTVMERVR
ncbi:phytoene/squalene synthase family protein [Hyphococcus flavus]|uniref:Phytoene/squalene synthase family protein n=1 Tax=Hyphococcus flavus TaxID=1866326 RepID=A0AAE9ZDB9_9PROT|nr:phytoene/squalene synthase family protein [Hyphococcus flavus]WDI31490.1 phytoene/squalene synthase family protein [Hyphococcus flavus]